MTFSESSSDSWTKNLKCLSTRDRPAVFIGLTPFATIGLRHQSVRPLVRAIPTLADAVLRMFALDMGAH